MTVAFAKLPERPRGSEDAGDLRQALPPCGAAGRRLRSRTAMIQHVVYSGWLVAKLKRPEMPKAQKELARLSATRRFQSGSSCRDWEAKRDARPSNQEPRPGNRPAFAAGGMVGRKSFSLRGLNSSGPDHGSVEQ